ncbi:MAG: response regulator transcription factor, partial [Cytophagales bacterium]
MMKKKIAIVEDNQTLREGYAFLINSSNKNFEVLNVFDSAESFFEQLNSQVFEIVLMDIDLPGIDGIEATKKLKILCPKVEVIMLTVWQEPSKVFQALEHGASGYVLKGASGIEIISALEELVQGGAPMSPA